MLSEDVAGERGGSARVESQIGDRLLTALFGVDVGSPQLAFAGLFQLRSFFHLRLCVSNRIHSPDG